jgi:exonuclease III
VVWHGQKGWNGVAILARGGEPTPIHRGFSAIRMIVSGADAPWA